MSRLNYAEALAEYVRNTVNAIERSGTPFVSGGRLEGPFYGQLIIGGPHAGRRKKAYWDNQKQVIIIRDPTAASEGTVFVSTPEHRDRMFPYYWHTLPAAEKKR
jgi:hypothetical protein